MLKTLHGRTTFGRSDFFACGRCKGLCALSKVSKRGGSVAFPKTIADVGHLKRVCEDAFSVAGAIQETCSSEMLGGPGVPERACILEHYCNCTTLITLHCNYNCNLQLQFHHTTATTTPTPTITITTALHHTTSSSCDGVTTATIATTPENITPTTFRSISGFALPSVRHNNQTFL